MKQRYIAEPSSKASRVIGLFLAAVTGIVMFGLLIACNLAQCLSLVVLPFSRRIFRQTNCAIAGFWWGLCVSGCERLYGIRFQFIGDKLPDGENAIVIANHQQMPDIIPVLALARRHGRIGNLKFFVKAGLKHVPGLGWGMQFLDFLFLSRAWEKDQDRIHLIFSRLLNAQLPFWLISYSEGTRITPEKSIKSQAYAKEHGIPPTEFVMLPRTKGFVASVMALRGRVNAVYDLTIGYPDGVATVPQMVKGYVDSFQILAKRYPIEEVPLEPEAVSAWLVERFQEKEAWLKEFYTRHGQCVS